MSTISKRSGLEPNQLSAWECADLAEALAEAGRGAFASDAEVAAFFAQCSPSDPAQHSA